MTSMATLCMKQINSILQLCRFILATLWIYQGVVPKLLGPHADELTMNRSIQPFWLSPEQISYYAGIGEVVFGVLIFLFYKKRGIYIWNNIALLGLLMGTWYFTPQFVTSAFNAFTLNIAMFGLGWIALICLRGNGYEWTFTVK